MHLLYITVADKKEAIEISKKLVEEKFLACANIIECASSIYWWEGEMKEEQECIIIAKTPSYLVDKTVNRIKKLHSYDCPCILSIKIEEGNEDFLKWVETSTKLPYS